jgi:hypothetical protein
LPDWISRMRQRRRRSGPGSRRENALSFLDASLAREVNAAMQFPRDWSNRATGRIQKVSDSYLVARANYWSIIGARHGIAFSYPLADRRILDFALSLPLERFVDRGFSRQPHRNAMAGILPESIRWRDTKFAPFPDLPGKPGLVGGWTAEEAGERALPRGCDRDVQYGRHCRRVVRRVGTCGRTRDRDWAARQGDSAAVVQNGQSGE